MQNKLDKKYYVWIWLGLIFACLLRNTFMFYTGIKSDIAESYTKGMLFYDIVMMLVIDGALPAAITFVLALIMYYIAARRHSNYVSRNDFCYWVMLFTIGPKVLTGIVECFAILDPSVYVVTSTLFDAILYPLVYLLMFIFILDKQYNLNPVERNNSFSILATVYMIVYGIGTFFGNLTIVSIGSDIDSYNEIMAELSEVLGDSWTFEMSNTQIICSAIAICVFFAYLITVIVLGTQYKKQAAAFRNDDTRETYYQTHQNRGYQQRDDVFDTFDEFEKEHVNSKDDNSDDNVFDEFDI